jgi:hypothetical protein
MDKSNLSDSPPHRMSASREAVAFAHQLDSDRRSDLEVKEDVMDKLLASTRKERAEVKVQYGKKTKYRAKTSPIKGSPTKTHYGSVSTSSHRPHTDQKALLHLVTTPSLITEIDDSDLTSLSSSATTSPVDSVMPKPPLYTPSKVVPLSARRGLKFGQLTELNEPVWSANNLGSYVWVFLEPKSNRVYDPDRDENDFKERLWWPAKVCIL